MLKLVLLAALSAAAFAGPTGASVLHQKRGEPPSSAMEHMELEMPGSEPHGTDSYLCVAFRWSELAGGASKVYVHGFQPLKARAETAHHLMLHSCAKPPGGKTGQIYDCRYVRTWPPNCT